MGVLRISNTYLYLLFLPNKALSHFPGALQRNRESTLSCFTTLVKQQVRYAVVLHKKPTNQPTNQASQPASQPARQAGRQASKPTNQPTKQASKQTNKQTTMPPGENPIPSDPPPAFSHEEEAQNGIHLRSGCRKHPQSLKEVNIHQDGYVLK